MTAPNETAYPQLNPEPSEQELHKYFTVTPAEIEFAQGFARRVLPRSMLVLHLKLFQRLARFSSVADVPVAIRQHILQSAGIAVGITAKEIRAFEASGSFRGLIKALQEWLGIRRLSKQDLEWLESVAHRAADTKQMVADIINVMLEELVCHRFELPAFSTLDRMAFQARESCNLRHFASITDQLSPQTKGLIDRMLKKSPDEPTSDWQQLKREPKRATNKETRSYLQHIKRLQSLVAQLPKPDIPMPKLKSYRTLARALDAAEMAELKPVKRYALAVILLRSRHSQALDDAADMLIRLMQNLENSARTKLLLFQQERSHLNDMLVGQLRDVLAALMISGSADQRVDAIESSLVQDPDMLISHCEDLLAFAGRNYLPFLQTPYKQLRAQLLNCVEITAPLCSSDDKTMEKMVAALAQIRTQRGPTVTTAELNLNQEKDFGWMSAAWRKLVFVPKEQAGQPGPIAEAASSGTPPAVTMHRTYFELAVLLQIKDEFKTGDLFVPYGEQYDDYREQLVDEQTFADELPEFGLVTGIETQPDVFVSELKSTMLEKCRHLDATFPANEHAELIDGRLVLRKPPQEQDGDEAKAVVQAFAEEITASMESIGILDALTDVEGWLDLHKHFRPLAGTESRLSGLRSRVITTLFCYGCNLGPAQTAKSIKGLSPRQVAWLNLKNVSEADLQRAIDTVIKAYNKLELPNYWGSGKHASADGTKWNLYEQNLVSEYHIRYGSYGGIGYYHVSDKFIALFSHFIACGTYEGVHILDGLMANESDIRPDTIHGDTQAQNYPVFALAHLLGIKLMPRIRGISKLNFFKPDGRCKFTNIESLFSGTIDWKLIETHLPSMLRIAVSIKSGKIAPSAILRRLGSQNTKNKLYFAFRELGKVVRTLFLLDYIGDVELRRFIHAETNKSEQFNGFAKWAFFGGDGIIAENMRHEQRKIIKYNHLVANMIILHNAAGMTQVLNTMRAQGRDITQALLASLGPYRTGNINRFGDYRVDMRRKTFSLNFEVPIIPIKS